MGRVCAAAMVVIACVLAAAPARAAAAGPPLGADGTTAIAYGYADAIREHVLIPVDGVDQDGDGIEDRTAIDIIRPDTATQVPVIIDPSPYYTTVGRGHESEKIEDVDLDGLNDRWPLFVDNYFVPRGYAVILADMDGTGHSTGCPMHGGPGDIASMKAVIDWLQGRVIGRDSGGNLVTANWDNGKAAMIGKSYDGTLANGVAATGVDGLTTIVSESAISDWYGYSRMGGIRFNTHYPRFLSSYVTNSDRRATCEPAYDQLDANDGDADGDRNDFWDERDYLADVDKVQASVLLVHGIEDDNVRLDHAERWWEGLAANGVPRKLWLSLEGHVDPFDFRRAEWVDTLHRWFDHWLWGVDNGIMSEPRVDIEVAPETWRTYADWPLPGTSNAEVALRAARADAPGSLAMPGAAAGGADSLTFTDASLGESSMMADPETVRSGRLAFLSPPLRRDLHLSGTPEVHLRASLDEPQSNLGALLVDYGTATHVSRSGDGIQDAGTAPTCWGLSSTYDDACYEEVVRRLTTGDSWRITKGILDSSNRDSLYDGTPAVPGQAYDFRMPLVSTEYVVPAGHRLGVILVGNYPSFSSIRGTTGASITVDTRATSVVLPVVGGASAATVALDAAAPSVAADVAGGASWTAGPRTVTLHAADEAGGSGVDSITWSKSGAETAGATTVNGDEATLTVAADGITTVSFRATDAAGNEGTEQTVAVKVDGTAPVVDCAQPDGAWHDANVALACTASDAASGLADPGDAAFTLSTHVAAGTRSDDAATGSRSVCDAAGNCATAGPIGGNRVDLVPPEPPAAPPAVTPTTPAAPAATPRAGARLRIVRLGVTSPTRGCRAHGAGADRPCRARLSVSGRTARGATGGVVVTARHGSRVRRAGAPIAHGAFSARLRLHGGSSWRLTLSYAGDARHRAAELTRSFRVPAEVAMRAPSARAPGAETTLRVAHARPNARVLLLERRPGHRWGILGRGRSSATGSLEVHVRAPLREGRWLLRARDATGSESLVEAVRVRAVTLDAVGDVNLGDGPGQVIARRGADWPWRGVGGVLRRADVALANLESAVSRRGAPVPKAFNFRGDPSSLRPMREVGGIDVAGLANNHVGDFGTAALLDTIGNVRRAGMVAVGAGESARAAGRARIVRRLGLRIAFVAFSDIGPPSFFATGSSPGTRQATVADVRRDVRAARRRADVVVAVMHWGIEYDPHPPSVRQRQLARAALDAGASAVIGAHPHVLQPIVRPGPRRVVAYSLGNFVFAPRNAWAARTGILELRLSARGVEGARLRRALIAGTRPELAHRDR